MTQSYVIGEEKRDDTASKHKSNAAAIGVLLGVLAGAGIHQLAFPLGIAGFAILGALGGVIVRFGAYPLVSKD